MPLCGDCTNAKLAIDYDGSSKLMNTHADHLVILPAAIAWYSALSCAFQISEVAPYYGQAIWFTKFHHEKLPSAIARYKGEIVRMFGVLDGVLAKQEWLVAGKVTVADLAYVTYVVSPPRP